MNDFYRANTLESDIEAHYAELGLTPDDYTKLVDELHPPIPSHFEKARSPKSSPTADFLAAPYEPDAFDKHLAKKSPDYMSLRRATWELRISSNMIGKWLLRGKIAGEKVHFKRSRRFRIAISEVERLKAEESHA
jgi:hypothetical protein